MYNSELSPFFSDRKASWERHKAYVETLFQISNSCVFVLEYNRALIYASPNFSPFFGYESSLINCPPLEANYLETRIHPDDLMTFSIIQKKLMELWDDLPADRRMSYKQVYELRVLNAENKYVRVISQHRILEMDGEQNPLLVLGTVDLSPNQTPYEALRFRIINNGNGQIIPFLINEYSNAKLTKRELQILKMIGEGMLSKEISDKLSISIYTVNGHRQNILQKLNVDNAVEAINSARKLGMLD
jgi:DNA-binding CsgD family transcriptional regulator